MSIILRIIILALCLITACKALPLVVRFIALLSILVLTAVHLANDLIKSIKNNKNNEKDC